MHGDRLTTCYRWGAVPTPQNTESARSRDSRALTEARLEAADGKVSQLSPQPASKRTDDRVPRPLGRRWAGPSLVYGSNYWEEEWGISRHDHLCSSELLPQAGQQSAPFSSAQILAGRYPSGWRGTPFPSWGCFKRNCPPLRTLSDTHMVSSHTLANGIWKGGQGGWGTSLVPPGEL